MSRLHLPSGINCLCAVLPLLLLPGLSGAASLRVLETKDAAVVYESREEVLAEEIPGACRGVRDELQRTLGFELTYRPVIRLVGEEAPEGAGKGTFRFIAYARPEERLVVLFLAPIRASGVPLASVLKHEVCHLLLHDAVGGDRLPRWLDEGIAQWASGGFSELAAPRRPFFLPGAILTGTDIPLGELVSRFPGTERDVRLAYEKSKSVVETLLETGGGIERLSLLLRALSRGEPAERAFRNVYGTTLEEFEAAWKRRVTGIAGWLFYLSRYLYEIVFFAGALAAFLGFLRYLRKKRAYRDDEDEGDGEDPGEDRPGRPFTPQRQVSFPLDGRGKGGIDKTQKNDGDLERSPSE